MRQHCHAGGRAEDNEEVERFGLDLIASTSRRMALYGLIHYPVYLAVCIDGDLVGDRPQSHAGIGLASLHLVLGVYVMIV